MIAQDLLEKAISPAMISATIALVGWLMKNALQFSINLLITYVTSLIKKLDDTATKVGVLDARLGELTGTISDFHKMKADMNTWYARLKEIETKLNEKH